MDPTSASPAAAVAEHSTEARVLLFAPDGSATVGGRELLEAPVEAGGAVWIDLQGHSPEHEGFLEAAGFHPLAIEDTFTLQHQPKLEEYPGELFVIVRGIDFNRKTERLDTLKLAAFVSPTRLVTYHRAPLRSVVAVWQRIVEAGRARPDMVHLFYLLCDELMDLYYPLVDEIGTEIEALEEAIFAGTEPSQLESILTLKRRLATIRRVMLSHRQIFGTLAGRQASFVEDRHAAYFRDVYDSVFRLADAADHQRDMLSSAKDTYLSAVAQGTNDVMKVLTLFSAILLPLTFIAGLYGMNFEHMPELGSPHGYYVVLGVMVVMALGMILWFRRRGWL